MPNPNSAAQAAEQEAVRRVLEPYAESYDMMTRMAQREGNRPIVSTTAVAIDIRGNMIPGVIDALSKLRATVAEQKPIKLSDDVLQFLKDGVADATQCEESDVDQAFADQLLLLMHTPLYTEPPPKQRAVDWGPLVVAPVADERAAVDPCGYVAVKVSAVDWLKDKFPALTIKAGLCERIGGRLYTITRLMRDHDAALASAPVAGEAQERIEQMAVNRYRPVPDGKFSYKVVAGDGSRSLYTGTKDSCLRVAAKLTEAFLDGAFVASDASPQSSKDGEHGE